MITRKFVVVIRGVGRGVEDASQRVRVVLLEKWISLGLVQKRKQPLGYHGPRGGARVAALEERHRVERLCPKRPEMQDVRLPVVDDREMVLGVLLERADREVKISRREREDEIRVRLFLHGHRLRVEARDRRGKENGRIARLERDGNLVDDKFIERLLRDLARVEAANQP